MNLENIINQLETVDPEIHERLNTRRTALRQFAGFAGKLSLAAVPLALGSMLNKAYSQAPPAAVLDVLNFALTLEYLEAEFYRLGIAAGDALTSGYRDQLAIAEIGKHEAEHVAFLKAAITSAGGTPVASPKFDFSGGMGSGNGPFKDAFKNYGLFLAVAQALEDTGVRAYKGQAGNLKGTGAVLTAALNIHSVEARHAAHIRTMRYRNQFSSTVKPWITGKDTGGIGALVQANYDGEENTIQAGISIPGINGFNISTNDATESFDEPLTKDQVLALVKPFLVP